MASMYNQALRITVPNPMEARYAERKAAVASVDEFQEIPLLQRGREKDGFITLILCCKLFYSPPPTWMASSLFPYLQFSFSSHRFQFPSAQNKAFDRGNQLGRDKTADYNELYGMAYVITTDNDRLKQGRITIEEFRRIYRIIAHREEIIEIFNTYSENQKFLFEKNLAQFLTQEQYTLDINKSTASEIIQKYEPIEEVKQAHQMSFEGFTRYMDSSECLLFNNKYESVYQDMTHPLSDYFISSSHNTYLISDQLVGPSDLWGYVSALVKGCRCLEIDCWDGSQNEPVVYHGYTFTSKLLFKTVIRAIHKYAFITSDYPVVLSLENHCSPSQQEVMADSLQSTFGDALLSDMLDDFPDKLPSPEALKFKILVRNKKIGTLRETRERRGSDKHGQVEECEEEEEAEQEEEENEAKGPEPSDAFQDNLEKEAESKRAVGIPLFKKKKLKIAMALSDLVIYTKAEKFRSFHHSRLYQQFNESNSIGESQARKLSKLRGHIKFYFTELNHYLSHEILIENVQFMKRASFEEFSTLGVLESSNDESLASRVEVIPK
eukprot:bmy_15743T0